MARRLTDQQRRRIAQQHARQRAAVHDSDSGPAEDGLGPEQTGRVIAHLGRQVEVEVAQAGGGLAVLRCHLRANLEPLVTGDTVVVRAGADDSAGVVVAGAPRRSLLARPDSRGVLRPVAANVDTMLVVLAPRPAAHAFLVDRYLVAAEHAGIGPVLVLNKTDLLPALPAEERAALEALLATYRQLGYPVLSLSAQDGTGLAALRARVQSQTVVFVGQSGVGKSSLVQALLPGVTIATGDLSAAMDKGRHTTTTARLYHVPDGASGGCVIDSPGIREFTLQHLSPAEVLDGFVELRNLAAGCRFRDCRHEQEPGCALRAAEAAGDVAASRLASYRHILTAPP